MSVTFRTARAVQPERIDADLAEEIRLMAEAGQILPPAARTVAGRLAWLLANVRACATQH